MIIFWAHNSNGPIDKNYLVDLHLNYIFQAIWILSHTHDVIKLNIKLTAQKPFTWQISETVVFWTFWSKNLIINHKNDCCHHKHFLKQLSKGQEIHCGWKIVTWQKTEVSWKKIPILFSFELLHYCECFHHIFVLLIISGITWQNNNKNLPIVSWKFFCE